MITFILVQTLLVAKWIAIYEVSRFTVREIIYL